jgi:peptidoglycan/xylan/chitin deacetylase (PgdA/CDA1 family)
MLHRVLDDAPAAFHLPSCYRLRGTALTAAELAQVVDQAGPILPLEAVERALAEGLEPPAGAVLTFDDGYREHLDVVAPILAERGHSATFYVAAGLHGEADGAALVDAWYWSLDHATERVAQVPLPGGRTYRGRLDSLEAKTAWVVGEPKAALLGGTPAQQAAMLEALVMTSGGALPTDLAARLYLRPAEWAGLVGLGMRVGAHSLRHPRLTQVDDDRLQAEVWGSVNAARPFGGAVAFAYPDGAFDDRVVQAVIDAGASSAVTCAPGPVTRRACRWRLPRVFVRPPTARAGSWT